MVTIFIYLIALVICAVVLIMAVIVHMSMGLHRSPGSKENIVEMQTEAPMLLHSRKHLHEVLFSQEKEKKM